MIDKIVWERVKKWLEGNYDEEIKKQVQHLIDHDPQELTDAFYRDLEFGTGGLRGIMGAGTNRMNKYTVGMATQGLANYLLKMFEEKNIIKVAIAFDSRNNSDFFARISAEVLSANGIKVFLFDSLRPTPELSFAIRYLNCQSGIVITASHNPKEYNGYKVYWDDGSQLVSPHDKNVIEEVNKITGVENVKFNGNDALIEMIGKAIDREYIGKILTQSLSPEIIKKQHDLKIVYTPIHGTGTKLVPMALQAFGFTNVTVIPEQALPDGNFPTVKSPNPEEPEALTLALAKAAEIDAELVLATDPDADRVGVAVKNNEGKFVLLNGNQTASILIYYLLNQWKDKGKITGKEYIVKTIVTTELLKEIADKNNVASFDTLTGFKFIAEVIRNNEGKKTFIGGGEESYGYLIGDFVRDKDAVTSCCMIAETAAWAKEEGKSMYNLLIDIYMEYGIYVEKLISVTKKGKTGAEEIQKMMAGFRNSPFKEINISKVVKIIDYLEQKEKNMISGKEENIDLPISNVLQFFTEDGSKITMRPSGTEPKIKFYFGIKGQIRNRENFETTYKELEKRVDDIISFLGLNT